MKTSGIYEITNILNGKKYIGQSENCYARWLSHRSDYLTGNNPLYNDMREYGIENFKFKVIERTSAYYFKIRKNYYIKKYNTLYPNGYN
jgi:group I intron endonuclease